MNLRCLGLLAEAGVSHPQVHWFLEPMAKPTAYPVGYFRTEEDMKRSGARQ
jgi:hypothetical protein